ncbi:hypothetical protein N8199_07480 [Emcibacteraceae bacterium]|nr:hypothetical protein [Emcibacteraceae bacterium]MDC1429722.1 hypothetical protein [Emcibacteraceae bacterium]
MLKPLEVLISVDTSFSLGEGAKKPFEYTPIGKRSVICDGNGLEFVLDALDRFQINASFFIETANKSYFGDEPMGNIVKKILFAGQDTQLLVDPSWCHFEQSGNYSANDSCAGRDYIELRKILEKSSRTFKKWNHKKPQVIRAVNGQVDQIFYKTIYDIGIYMSSSVGLEMYIPHGKEMLLYTGRSKIADIMEVPLFTYKDKDIMGGYPSKTLQIATSSWKEMLYILKKARKMEVESIVLSTKPSDYIKKKNPDYSIITRNRVNQERLLKLCSFINENDQDFVAVDFSMKADEWIKSESSNIRKFKVPTRFRNGRKIENLINNLFWKF